VRDADVEEGRPSVLRPQRLAVGAEAADGLFAHLRRHGKAKGDGGPPGFAVAGERLISQDLEIAMRLHAYATARCHNFRHIIAEKNIDLFVRRPQEFADRTECADALAVLKVIKRLAKYIIDPGHYFLLRQS
jgi:hypothetical protein